MSKKVIVAGHICVDITPVIPGKKVSAVSELLLPGKLIGVGKAAINTGGVVANTGLAMKILGADVALRGKVGKDAFGDIVRGILEKYDAAEGLLVSDEDETSYTVVLAIPGIDRIFLHDAGANDTFCAADVSDELLKEAALLHYGYPPLMKAMYENEGEELLKLMQHARSMNVATSLDLAAVDDNSERSLVNWKGILEKTLPYVDFFVPSVEELCYMLDKEKFFEWQERAAGKDITEVLDVEKDVKPLADRCMELGVKVLLIKCGVPGMYYRTASAEELAKISPKVELDITSWADQEGFERSFVPDAVLSGTGCGDTSIAAFLTAMMQGASIGECVELAAATGASCVAAYDSLSGLKSLDELRARIRNGWAKQ